MKLMGVTRLFPSWQNALLAVSSALLLILAFPPFEWWFTVWFALVPLLWAVERERDSLSAAFINGWLFGNVFFFGTCWWLTYAPIVYAGFPAPLAYALLFGATSLVAVFPGLFSLCACFLLRRYGYRAILLLPAVWTFGEFLRYWLTGNNWNALAYSQAFNLYTSQVQSVSLGGIYLAGFELAALNSTVLAGLVLYKNRADLSARYSLYVLLLYFHPILAFGVLLADRTFGRSGEVRTPSGTWKFSSLLPVAGYLGLLILPVAFAFNSRSSDGRLLHSDASAFLIGIQPNVPMSNLGPEKWRDLRYRHAALAEQAFEANAGKLVTHTIGRQTEGAANDHDILKEIYLKRFASKPKIVVFPESPMNFMYEEETETQQFINGFAKLNNLSVLFNSAEPDASNGKYFNSAVMVGPEGREVVQYDKIYLLPFGEAVPFPLGAVMPGFVGTFSHGKEYDLFPMGDAKAGVMICFESHFGQLSREYVRNGADVIIEMTNDGYLGPTPVLRQHLANAVFRAVETNRPVLRVTNVGITAYVNERGEVLDAAEPYVEDTRVWAVGKSDGSQTFYVRYGDWFAWLCSLLTIAFVAFALLRRKPVRLELGRNGS